MQPTMRIACPLHGFAAAARAAPGTVRRTDGRTEGHGIVSIRLPRTAQQGDGAGALKASPRNPLHDAIVWFHRLSSSMTRRNQYHTADALACARRRSDIACCNGIDMPP